MRKLPALLLATILVFPAFAQGTTPAPAPPNAGTTDNPASTTAKKKAMKQEKKIKEKAMKEKKMKKAPAEAPATTP